MTRFNPRSRSARENTAAIHINRSLYDEVKERAKRLNLTIRDYAEQALRFAMDEEAS